VAKFYRPRRVRHISGYHFILQIKTHTCPNRRLNRRLGSLTIGQNRDILSRNPVFPVEQLLHKRNPVDSIDFLGPAYVDLCQPCGFYHGLFHTSLSLPDGFYGFHGRRPEGRIEACRQSHNHRSEK